MSYSNFGVEDISRKIVLKNYTIIFGKDISSRATLKSHTIRATLKSHTIIFLVDSNIQSRQMKVGMGRARWLETTSKGHGWIGWLWYNDAKLRVFVKKKKRKGKSSCAFYRNCGNDMTLVWKIDMTTSYDNVKKQIIMTLKSQAQEMLCVTPQDPLQGRDGHFTSQTRRLKV